MPNQCGIWSASSTSKRMSRSTGSSRNARVGHGQTRTGGGAPHWLSSERSEAGASHVDRCRPRRGRLVDGGQFGRRSVGGSGGGVPPNVGHNSWWAHQEHIGPGLGRQSPMRPARSMARHRAASLSLGGQPGQLRRAGSEAPRRCPDRSVAGGGAPVRRSATAPARRTASGTSRAVRSPPAGHCRSCSRQLAARPSRRRDRAGRRNRASAALSPASSRRRAPGRPARAGVDLPDGSTASPDLRLQRATRPGQPRSPRRTTWRLRVLSRATVPTAVRPALEPLRRALLAAGRSNSRSSTACTSVPRVAAWLGGSGNRSMVRNRNSSGQVMKSAARDGESDGPETATAAAPPWPAVAPSSAGSGTGPAMRLLPPRCSCWRL